MEMADPIPQTERQPSGLAERRGDGCFAPRRRAPKHDRILHERALERRAVGLGWFSIGLGLADLLAPRQVARLIGADDDDATTRAVLMGVGVRELACGVGLLSKVRPALWAWARLAGDVMDFALLGYIWSTHPVSRDQVIGAGGTVLGAAWADAQAAYQLTKARVEPLANGVFVRQAVTVQRTPQDAYAFFRTLENLPSFMWHVESVVEQGARSRWRARGAMGMSIEWEAEIVEDRSADCLAWRSLPGADVANRGRVVFRPAAGGRASVICVELSYDPPAGAIGTAIAQLFGREPSQQVSADLRRLKQVLETGEVLHSDASIHRGLHPARPQLRTPEQRQHGRDRQLTQSKRVHS